MYTNKQVADMLATLSSRMDAFEVAPVVAASAPVVASAAAPIVAKARTYYTKAEIAEGLGFLCTLGCGRRLRRAESAASHSSKDEHFHTIPTTK